MLRIYSFRDTKRFYTCAEYAGVPIEPMGRIKPGVLYRRLLAQYGPAEIIRCASVADVSAHALLICKHMRRVKGDIYNSDYSLPWTCQDCGHVGSTPPSEYHLGILSNPTDPRNTFPRRLPSGGLGAPARVRSPKQWRVCVYSRDGSIAPASHLVLAESLAEAEKLLPTDQHWYKVRSGWHISADLSMCAGVSSC